jgi:ParB family chromosome partitioning protein
MLAKRKALGRGLDALLPVVEQEPAPSTDRKTVADVDINSIVPNPYQPRTTFNEEALADLVDSIRTQGVIQPVLVRRVDRKYQLVAGERRWRAAKLAEKTSIPAIVIEPTEQEMLEYALLENIQREDLNAIEEARAYQTLLQEFGLSQEEVAHRVGKKRSSIANSLRLLKLSANYQRQIAEGLLTAGHGRAILAVADPALQTHLHDAILKRNLSVRQAEVMANRLNKRRSAALAVIGKREIEPQLANLGQRLAERFGAKAAVKPMGKTRGRVEIYYHSLDDLDRILGVLGITQTSQSLSE